jgi:TPR repeat protein
MVAMRSATFGIMLVVFSLSGLGTGVRADAQDEAAVPDPLEEGIAAYQRGDFASALRLFQPLAAQGSAPAQSNLGLMYEEGRGVAQNYREAVRLFRLAAIQGDPSAQSNLGVMYERGQGIAQDYSEAIKWYRLAAERRNPEALINLGVAYKEGRGVGQDWVRAHMWFNLAASKASGQNADLAIRNRDLLTKGLTREQLFLAQDMARRCEANGLKSCE